MGTGLAVNTLRNCTRQQRELPWLILQLAQAVESREVEKESSDGNSSREAIGAPALTQTCPCPIMSTMIMM